MLRRSANVPPGWNTQLNGAGVVDIVALLEEALPDAEEMQPLPEINVLPIVAEPVEAVVDIDHLTVRDDGEAVGGAKPYLLVTFFQIDGDTARIEATVDVSAVTVGGTPTLEVKLVPANGRDSFVSTTRRGRHGNVDEVNIGPIELHFDGPKTVNIDGDVGVYRRTITPIPIRLILDGADVTAGADIIGLPGFVGVHAILAKQNLTPDDAVVAAHRVVRDGIRSILEDVLETVDLSDLSVDPSAFVERTAEIEDAAKAAAAAEMDWWETFCGGVVDPDDQLIQVFAVANVLQLSSPMPIEKRYQGDYGDWILVGEIRLA